MSHMTLPERYRIAAGEALRHRHCHQIIIWCAEQEYHEAHDWHSAVNGQYYHCEGRPK